ncbi:MAG: glutathione S-transferase N-terminal domain-containing protein [Gammaproteobacteria bacterium]|nr:glutathione S-transferase N-terminal domain-containing protein [Gammaproteobacteria bacterium]
MNSEKAEIEFYYWPTPNGWKVAIMLEELGVRYELRPINIAAGEQYDEIFAGLSPNNKIPALRDLSPDASLGKAPMGLFESGAILEYLAGKYDRFIPTDSRKRWECIQWLFWQVGGLGPMGGQAHHFRRYADEDIEYAKSRYTRECHRLYGVLNRRLQDRTYLCDEYTIADMACLPWIYRHEWQGIALHEFPALMDWYRLLMSRDAVKRAFALGEGLRKENDFSSVKARGVLFGQTETSDKE